MTAATISAARAGEVLGLNFKRTHELAARYGIGRNEGGGNYRRWTESDLAAAAAYAEMVPPMDRPGGEPPSAARSRLIENVVECAKHHPTAVYVVASPDWSRPAWSPEQVVAIYRTHGGCTVVPLGAALERFAAAFVESRS